MNIKELQTATGLPWRQFVDLVADLMDRRPSCVEAWLTGRSVPKDSLALLEIRLKERGYI